MILVIDYGLGNIRSVSRAIEKAGAEVVVSSKPEDIQKAGGIVLPGVGAFQKAMKNIKSLDLLDCLKNYLRSQKPYLGICLGMQILFNESYEHGQTAGFGIIDGVVKKFSGNVKIPHMGWNQVKIKKKTEFFDGISDNSYFYFDHSYYAIPNDSNAAAGTTDYGITFTSAVKAGNIWGVQFHPEKSGDIGLKFLRNFLSIC